MSCKKASFLVQGLQDLVQDLASLARKILGGFGYFLQDVFTGLIGVNIVNGGTF